MVLEMKTRKQRATIMIGIISLCGLLAAAKPVEENKDGRPNMIFILSDDMKISDVSIQKDNVDYIDPRSESDVNGNDDINEA